MYWKVPVYLGKFYNVTVNGLLKIFGQMEWTPALL